ncbi:FAD-dependent oxidoreductase [Clostridioides difficile]|nr:FAD-dependent oxidoreductase [Clostridioides difficile]
MFNWCKSKHSNGSGYICKIDRGIVVDKTLQTTVKDIYACGDVAQVGNTSLAIWPSSVEMGK